MLYASRNHLLRQYADLCVAVKNVNPTLAYIDVIDNNQLK